MLCCEKIFKKSHSGKFSTQIKNPARHSLLSEPLLSIEILGSVCFSQLYTLLLKICSVRQHCKDDSHESMNFCASSPRPELNIAFSRAAPTKLHFEVQKKGGELFSSNMVNQFCRIRYRKYFQGSKIRPHAVSS